MRSSSSREAAQALALWRGPPLADFRYHEFAQIAIARLEEQRLAIVDDRIEAELGLGRHADVVSELEATTAAFPLRERPRGQLMLASIARGGRRRRSRPTRTRGAC
jgi:DNA-binding SARP family transcriptional activator